MDASIGTHGGKASAHHAKTADFNELAGQVSEAQIPDATARDSEVAAEVATLQADIAALQGQLQTLQGTVDGLTTLLASASLEDGGTTFRFTGVNVQSSTAAETRLACLTPWEI